jgi:hypothetical protein
MKETTYLVSAPTLTVIEQLAHAADETAANDALL